MNHWYDGEQQLLSTKQQAIDLANRYAVNMAVANGGGWSTAYRRMMAGLGGRLIVIGYRLQIRYDRLSVVSLPEAPKPRATRAG